jgi:alpha-1,3-rhamnosyl/mannosyltransferase
VVASRAGSLPEVVGEAGLLVDPLDPQAWREAMARLLSDGALRSRLAQQGRARAAAFTVERQARETVAVYRAAAGQPA